MAAKRFRIAFSFAGEKRDFVEKVAGLLAQSFGEEAILYDKFHEAEFSSARLGRYLPKLYHEQSDLVVVVICRDYAAKEWCGLEWDAIFDLLKQRREGEVMLSRFDYATIDGLFSDAGFSELDHKTAEQFTALILQRLALNEAKPKDYYTPPVAQAPELASPDTPREPLVDFEAFRRYVPPKLIGREDQTDSLSAAWTQAQKDEAGRPLVVTITGMGGEGKSSLVAKWAASLGDQGWPGCDAVLAWSFYSQGTREVASVSAERFLKYALAFFRDPKTAGSSASAAVKGERLAEIIGQQRTLLILDGLEPLQYPPTVPMAGQLRDTGLSALLQGLSKKNRGLCVVTTRIAVHDLDTFLGGTVRELPLGGLSADAGATLLQKLGVEGDIELMKKLAIDVRGHALTLTLLGSFLKRAYGGNIARRDQVKLEKADATVQGGHAFRAMEAYEQWLLQGGDEGRREVTILRLMGLFDRPADAVSIQKLRSEIVRDFNEPLVGLSDEDLSLSLFTLEEAHLLTVDRQESGEPKSIDAHPLLREYFAGKISRATRKRAEALLTEGDGGDAEHGDDNSQTSESRPQRDLVFISYNETDRSSRDIVRKVLESDPDIRSRVWDYNDIPAGSDVPNEIARHLARAKLIVMITSPAYVDATPGARHFEIDSALEARERNEMDILWIPARSYKFETPPVGHIMAATGPNPVPLENLRGEKRDNALLSLLSAVRRSLGLPLPTTFERDKREVVEEPHDRRQNALALSGGGFRATFFHLGVLAFHFRRGALGELNIITAVSGGSILAAHAVLHWETLKRDEAGFRTVMAKLVTLARSNVRDRILVRWLWSVGTGRRLLGTAATRLARSRTGRLVRAYRDFYREQPLHNLQQPDRPWLALVATDLHNSSRIYFSHDGMRRISIADSARQEPFPEKIELDIAFAVAASSCFPPVFRPLVLDYNVLKVRWDKFKLRLHLQDGGVHDNLGLRALQYIAPPENVSLGTIHASYANNPPDIREPHTGLLADRLRALRIFTQGELAEIANDIATLAGAKPLIVKLGHYVPEDGPHMLNTATQTALMSFRTDLDAPTWQELYALMAHGYQVAAMQSEYLDEGDLREARSMLCAILAESLAKEHGSTPEVEMHSLQEMASNLSAKDLRRCGVRPKGRIAIHFVLYFLLLLSVAFSAQRYGTTIAAWISDFYKPRIEQISTMQLPLNRSPNVRNLQAKQILDIAANSPIARHNWLNRGVAPIGYTKGMAAAYALIYCNWKVNDPGSLEMARAPSADNANTDALAISRLNKDFEAVEMHNDVDGADTLRHLFVLLTSLGMQESSGRFCEGRDLSNHSSNSDEDFAEAGLFSSSYVIASAIPQYSSLVSRYANSLALLDIFQEGVSVRPKDLENVGFGPGFDFQRVSKRCPAFAVECAALGLRRIANYWGPILRRDIELRPECDEMLRQVQELIDNAPDSVPEIRKAFYNGSEASPAETPVLVATPTPLPNAKKAEELSELEQLSKVTKESQAPTANPQATENPAPTPSLQSTKVKFEIAPGDEDGPEGRFLFPQNPNRFYDLTFETSDVFVIHSVDLVFTPDKPMKKDPSEPGYWGHVEARLYSKIANRIQIYGAMESGTNSISATLAVTYFGPTQINGFWSVIRETDKLPERRYDWKLRMPTVNETP